MLPGFGLPPYRKTESAADVESGGVQWEFMLKRFSFRWHKAIVARFKAADEIVLRANGGGRRCQPDGNLDGVPVVGVVDSLGVIPPRIKMAFQRLGKVAGVGFANVENLPGAAMADDVCAGLVAERV